MAQQTDLPINEKFEYSKKEHDDKYIFKGAEIDPLDDREPDDGIPYQFTWRAVIIGSLLGSIIAASNMYIGLKSGWTFGASIFGAILGFTLIKPMEKLPTYLGGGPFGIKENCTAQTAATAAGGLSAGYITAIPALFRLDLLPGIDQVWDMMFLWTFAAAFYGLFFAIPLRKYFVIQQKLVFPSPVAAAVTIRSLHGASGGSPEEANVGQTQGKVILWSFLGSTIYKVISYFAPFVVDLHPLWWIGNATSYQPLMDISSLWRWHLQLTTAFIGAGMMTGTNSVLSLMAGNFFAWAIVAPYLFYFSEGIIDKEAGPWYFIVDLKTGLITPQLWLLWPGIVIMIVASFTELFCQYRSVYNGLKGGFLSVLNFFIKLRGGIPVAIGNSDGSEHDPVPDSEQIPGWQWGTGIVVSTVCTILILKFYFDVEWYLGLLAVILGFVLSFVATQSSGETDINPTGVIGKTSQFIFAPFKHGHINIDLKVNLIAGNVAASCAAQTVDMVGDLKTGHLLRASPRSQFYAQIIGSIFGVVVAVVIFWVFGKAYPCILKLSDGDDHCPFEAPSVTAWYGVAVALTTDISKSIPPSCRIACLVFGIITFVSVIAKHTFLKNYARYMINWNAFGIALVNPSPYLFLAFLYGLIIEKWWEKASPDTYKHYNIPLASGLIAGEGIGGVIQAIFQISGLNQEIYATSFACPTDGC